VVIQTAANKVASCDAKVEKDGSIHHVSSDVTDGGEDHMIGAEQ